MPTDFDKKLDILKVQKAEILRDSLEDVSAMKNTPTSLPTKARVENEAGEVLEVEYDPVLKCYYDPKTNSYYDLK